ncbi:MAG: cysteine--tRNA ligase [Candidatus Tenebribacter burtonii]|jgi:cysteinyl-tRNA synthetase|nr:cysteine--tRNA ligase [Candidatus Tenebribacter burtonii]
MKIYNTLTNKKEEFIPIETNKVRMYVCGPTVYNYFHIGNARPLIFFDVVKNFFEYIGNKVTFVRNITDIDDKLINRSIEEKIPVSQIAEKYTKAFFDDCNALEINPADHHPKATEYINDMIKLIKELVEKKFAYEVNGDVYFSVSKFTGYGKLSGKKLEDLQAGARVEANKQKKHPADFTLWKRAKQGEPKWASPWGKGRPGWHTECVVMSRKLLGGTFDIHGGGIDLIFPHHENEIAQAEASKNQKLANYWMHNGYLNIEGEKMSKSLNNFFTARDILKKYDAEAIRFFFLSKHYRNPIDFNENIIKESSQAVKNFYNCLKSVDYLSFKDEKLNDPDNERKANRDLFLQFMNNDFNTAQVIALLFEIASVVKNNDEPLYRKKIYSHLLVEFGNVLGFFQDLDNKLSNDLSDISGELIELIINIRNLLKKEKNWEIADAIRKDLKEIGIILKDTPKGTNWSINN